MSTYYHATCQCGHTARGHGPRLGEAFHRGCMWCPCTDFDAVPETIHLTVSVHTQRR